MVLELLSASMACRGAAVRIRLAPLRSQTASYDAESAFLSPISALSLIGLCASDTTCGVQLTCNRMLGLLGFLQNTGGTGWSIGGLGVV